MAQNIVIQRRRKRYHAEVAMEVGENDVVVQQTLKTVKTGLRSFIVDQESRERIISKIREDVTEVSMMAYETSLLIFHDLLTRLKTEEYIRHISFRNYFAMLRKDSKHDMPQDYLDLRRAYPSLELYNNAHKGHLYDYQADSYETAFKNNIWMHAYARVKALLRKLLEEIRGEKPTGKELYEILNFLFEEPEKNASKRKKRNENMTEYKLAEDLEKGLGEVFPSFHFYRGCFSDVNKEPISHLLFFYKLQCVNEMRNWKNFQLIPLIKCGLRHIQYDMCTFYSLLCSLDLCPQKANPKPRPKGNVRRWKPCVNVDRNELVWSDWLDHKKDFAGTFTTNGVEVSIRYNVAKLPQGPKTSQQCDQYMAIDPGFKLKIAAVKAPGDGVDKKDDNIKISNRQYQYDSGFHSRKKKLKKLTGDIESYVESDRQFQESILNDGTPIIHKGNKDFEKFVDFQLKTFTKKVNAYCKPKVARLKFDKYIRTKETMSGYVNDMIGDAKMTKCFYGDMTTAPNCPIKGYIRLPGKELRKTLANHPKIDLENTDEFRSTMLCSICFTKMKVSKSPHRFATCPNCKRVWNRDINGAKNILQNGLHKQNGTPMPKEFSRSFKFP